MILNINQQSQNLIAQSAESVEYSDCTSAETPPPQRVSSIWH